MTTTNNNSDNNFKITDNWTTQAKNLKDRFKLLSDSDLACEPGKEEEMLKRVETRLSKDRTAVLSIIRSAQQNRPAEGPKENPEKK